MVQFTRAVDGQSFAINPDAVSSVEVNAGDGSTEIKMNNGDTFTAREQYQTVIADINRARGKP
jgi:uncharacterized protein YlzI (FlbEa/FlbD family)